MVHIKLAGPRSKVKSRPGYLPTTSASVQPSNGTSTKHRRATDVEQMPGTVKHEADVTLRDGEVYIQIHIGWKTLVAFALVIAESTASLLTQQFHLFGY
jgi:hypothetical protein